MSDFWTQIEEELERVKSGGGIVGKVRVESGLKVFVSGMAQEDTFFPCMPNNKTPAMAKAKKLGEPQFGIQIRAFKEFCVKGGEPVTWKDDRFFFTGIWTSACSEVVLPSIKQFDIDAPWEGWAKIGFKADPFRVAQGEAGKVDTDAEGNPRYPQIAYIAEVYKTKEEAFAAAMGAGAGGVSGDVEQVASKQDPDVPPDGGWTKETWDAVKPDLKSMQASGQSPKQIADSFGVQVVYVIKALNS